MTLPSVMSRYFKDEKQREKALGEKPALGKKTYYESGKQERIADEAKSEGIRAGGSHSVHPPFYLARRRNNRARSTAMPAMVHTMKMVSQMRGPSWPLMPKILT